jgi:iron complex transport system permease protein
VSPDILGATAGAGFGAALAILFSWSLTMIQVSSFIFGLFAVFLTYFISSKMKNNQILVLVLTGVLIGTLFSSFISLIKYIADPFDKLPAITFWLMGSLATVRTADIYIVIIPVLIGILPLYLLRWRLNVLSFGDEEAKAMGINTDAIRVVIIICSTLVTASAVCISGVIGWVGLVIPHLARAVVGPDYNKLLPASILLGSSYLLLVDTIARVVTYIEIPLGILTSLIGAPFFIYLLNKSRWG